LKKYSLGLKTGNSLISQVEYG